MSQFDGVPKVSPARGALVLATPEDVAHVDLTGAAFEIVPPAGINFVVFAATGDFAVEWADATVAVFPTANAAPAVRPELNPAARYIGNRHDINNFPGGPGFSVIGGGTGVLTASLYS